MTDAPAQPRALPVANLQFDRHNPRLAEHGIGPEADDADIIAVLWETMDVLELVQSISASGFFAHEPLIVLPGYVRNIVIEGNRRLAAVKLLLEPEAARAQGWDVPTLSSQELAALRELPVIVTASREDSWRYLGFKHVNGPVKWTSYAKAEYIASVHRRYDVPLADIARQIGDRHKTVQRLYRGLMVIEQAEREGVYQRDNRYVTRFAFSHLYTGLDYTGIGNFLGLIDADAESADPVPGDKLGELGELCTWLYGDKRCERAPVVQRQNPNLRELDAVLGNAAAVAALRAGQPLSVALKVSRPSSTVFEDALHAVKRELQTAHGHATTGYDGAKRLLEVAGEICDLADDLYSAMEKKQSPRGRRNRQGSGQDLEP